MKATTGAMRRGWMVLAVAALSLTGPAMATTYYVSMTGNDLFAPYETLTSGCPRQASRPTET